MKRAAFCLAIMLSACGGGGSGGNSTPDASIAGIWTGSFTEQQPSSSTFDLTALISPSGQTFAYSQQGGRVYTANLNAAGNTLSGSFLAFDIVNGSSFSLVANVATSGTLTGQAQSQSQIGAAFSNSQGAFGTTALTFSSVNSNRAASLAAIAGTYSNQDGSTGFTTTITVGANGQFTGSDSAGCTYSGSLSVPNAADNVYAVSGSESCPSQQTQTGTGLASLLTSGSQTILAVGIANNNVATAALLVKQ